MGLTADCDITLDGKTAKGSAHLEPAEVRILSPRKAIIPFAEIQSAEAREGKLTLRRKAGDVTLHLGKAAETWALKIRYPRGRIEKLGVKPGSRVIVRGLRDKAFIEELKAAGAKVALKAGSTPCDIVIQRLDAISDLPNLKDARSTIVPNGMIWAVWPKGRKEFREDDIRRFGPEAGLVDIKVMSFSDELSGLKLVIPVAQR